MQPPQAATSLLSATRSSDSRLQVQLHPLVILTVSDYITRHALRQQKGPIVGAILGSQHARDITMEQAFECKLETVSGNDVVMDATWFHSRLQQYKDVHKAPPLDLVAWFTLGSSDGPQPHHLPIHQQLLSNYNESALLLLFHPNSVADGKSKGGKLPLTIYESIQESVVSAEDGDKQMFGSSGDSPQLSLRFQELPYTIETGEAEMIGIDFVARGGANATLAEDAKQSPNDSSKALGAKDSKSKSKPRNKSKGKEKDITIGNTIPSVVSDIILSAEDEDYIASLTAKANAIRMLQQRISLMKSYIESIPPCFLTQPAPAYSSDAPRSTAQTILIPSDLKVCYPILRQTSALLARLPLLTPSATASSKTITASMNAQSHLDESQRLASDVALTTLLGTIGTTISTTQRMGRKAGVFEAARRQAAEKENFQRVGHGQGQGMEGFDGLNGGGHGGSGGGGGRGRGGAEDGDGYEPRGLSVANANVTTGPGGTSMAMEMQDERWEEMDEE